MAPLHHACALGHLGVVKLLLEHPRKKADLRKPDGNECMPFFIACINGHADIVRYLLETKGAALNGVDQDGCVPLHYACTNGSVEVSRLLLELTDANVVDKDGYTPIHLACYHGNERVAQLLLEQGAAPDARSKAGETPVDMAREAGQDALVQLLKGWMEGGGTETPNKSTGASGDDDEGEERRWNSPYDNGIFVPEDVPQPAPEESEEAQRTPSQPYVSQRDHDGWTALHLKCARGFTQEAAHLLHQGADVNAVNNYNETPLYFACLNGHAETAEMLILNGADNRADDAGLTPLHVACREGHGTTAQLLLAFQAIFDVNALTPFENGRLSPLHMACAGGYVGMAKLLLDCGASVNEETSDGDVPLHLASRNGYEDVARLLLEQNNAEPEKSNNRGKTPLEEAHEYNRTAVTEFLSSWMANKIAADLRGTCLRGERERVWHLLEAGADVNGTDNEGLAPLHVACFNGHNEVTQILLRQGADLHRMDTKRKTPLHVLCSTRCATPGHTYSAKLLLDGGAARNCADIDGLSPLHHACRRGHTELAELLINEGAAVDMVDNSQSTPLHNACGSTPLGGDEHQNITQLLLSAGAGIDMARDDGNTPLHLASFKGNHGVVKQLLDQALDRGLDLVDLVNKDQNSSLHLACSEGRKATAQLLLDYGATADLLNKDGKSPIDLATVRRKANLVELLDCWMASKSQAARQQLLCKQGKLLSQKEEQLQQIKQDLAQKDSYLQQKSKQLNEKEELLADKEQQQAEKERHLSDLRSDSELQLASKDQQLAEKERQLSNWRSAFELQLASKDQQVQHKDQQLADMQNLSQPREFPTPGGLLKHPATRASEQKDSAMQMCCEQPASEEASSGSDATDNGKATSRLKNGPYTPHEFDTAAADLKGPMLANRVSECQAGERQAENNILVQWDNLGPEEFEDAENNFSVQWDNLGPEEFEDAEDGAGGGSARSSSSRQA